MQEGLSSPRSHSHDSKPSEKGIAQGALEPHPHLAPQLVLNNNHLSRGLEVLAQVHSHRMFVWPWVVVGRFKWGLVGY